MVDEICESCIFMRLVCRAGLCCQVRALSLTCTNLIKKGDASGKDFCLKMRFVFGRV